MARKKKQALSQRVVGVATIGLPAPVRKVLQKRYVAIVLLLLLPTLLATGVVTINWQQGFPKVGVHPEQFAAAKSAIFAKIQRFRGLPTTEGPVAPGAAPFAAGQPTQQANGWPQPNGFTQQQPTQFAGYAPAGQASPQAWNPGVNPAPPNAWGTTNQPKSPQQAANTWEQPTLPSRDRW